MPIQPTPRQVTAFQEALRDELRTAWQQLRAARPHDQFYGFGLYTGDDDLDDDEFDDTAPDLVAKAVLRASYAALKSLAKEGVFGQGAERESLTLSIWQYDESEKQKLAAARKLNPERVVARYEAELADRRVASRAWQELYVAKVLRERAQAKAAAARPAAG